MKYKISELAKLLGVSTNTVRRYEDMGYISAVRDEKSGYRYYNDDDIFSVMNAKLHVILYRKNPLIMAISVYVADGQ